MKQLAIAILTLFTLSSFAQEKKERKQQMSQIKKEMTAEDMATLRTKKLTLSLDLNNTQQSQVYDMLLSEFKQVEKNKSLRQANNAENGKALSKDEFVTIQNQKLDRKIAIKQKMKTLLTEEQYSKYEAMQEKRHGHSKHKKLRQK